MALTSSTSGYNQANGSQHLNTYDSILATQWYRASSIVDAEDGIGYSYISASGDPNFGHAFVLINATNSLVVRSHATHPTVSDVTCISSGAASGNWRHVGMYINKNTNVQRAYADGAVANTGVPTSVALGTGASPEIRVHFRTNNVAVAELALWVNLSQAEADEYAAQMALGVHPAGLPKMPLYYWKFLEPPVASYRADVGDKILNAAFCSLANHPPVDVAYGVCGYLPKLTPPLTGPYGVLVASDAARRASLYVGRL